MATEDELPEELDKLEITPVLPQIKLLDSNLPVQLNPFFENDLNNKVEEKTGAAITKPSQALTNIRTRNQSCRRCRYREGDLKELIRTSSDRTENTRIPLSSGVLKQILKKSAPSVGCAGNRKIILREPVLKALQTCLDPNSNVRRNLLASAATSTAAANNEGPLTTKGMSDFRDLIDECHSLLSEDVDFSGRLNQMCLKKFTTMQSPKIHNKKSRNNEKPKITAPTISLPLSETTEALNEDYNNAHVMSLSQLQVLGTSSSTNIQQRNISNLSQEQISNHARSNTTCSQQAGNSAAGAACDDVTIDELASYFDTFVHIPKKMSSMAEMMYI